MRSIPTIKAEIADLDNLLISLGETRKRLSSELWDAQRAKSRRRPSQDELNARYHAEFAGRVVPGVFVRVIGARSYPWKYVDNLDDNTFIGKAVSIRRRGGYELVHSNVSVTMLGKIRELLTLEEFEERFGAMV